MSPSVEKGKQPINILIAYPYFLKEWQDFLRNVPREDFRLIVDSGAFSAWSCGMKTACWDKNMKVDLDDYCKFLDDISDLRPFNAVQFDVYGDPEQSYKNFLEMNKRGYDVMPVFTRGETLERLDEFYDYTDYIMFGGIAVGGANKQYVKWFQNNNKGRKSHWLGFTSTDFISYYKPESVDASSWANCQRFGQMLIYDGNLKTKPVTRELFTTRPPKKVIDQLLAVGATYEMIKDLAFQESWWASSKKEGKYNTMVFVSMLSSIKQAMEIEQRFGTKQYFAVSADAYWLQRLFKAFYYGRERGIW